MLINSDIKKILGGGCEIKEVRHKDKVVWEKASLYIVNCIFRGRDELVTVFFNAKKAEPYSSICINTDNQMFRLQCIVKEVNSCRIAIYIDNKKYFNSYVSRGEPLDTVFTLKKGINTIEVYEG